MGRIGRGVVFVFAAQLVAMGASGALIVVLTRYLLDPSDYGLLFLTMSVLSVAMLFANLGFEKAGARFVAKYRETEPELVPTVVRKTLLYNCLAIGVVCAGIALFHTQIATLVGEPAIGGLVLVGTGYVVVKSLSDTALILFQGFNEMGWVALIRIVSNSLLLLAVPGFILLELGLTGAIMGYILGYLVTMVVGLAVLYRRFSTAVDVVAEKTRDVSRRLLRYSIPLTMTMSANVINGRADIILLSVFRGPTEIGFYTLGKQVATFVNTPAQSLGFGLSPTFGEDKAAENIEQAARLYERSVTYTMAIYAPAAAGIILVADPGIRQVFGAPYAGSIPVLQILSIYVFIRSFDAITSDALDFMGRARARAIAKTFVAVGNVVLNLILIPPFGVVGATVATVVTYAVYVGAEMVIMFDELPLDGRGLLRSGLVVAGITTGMVFVVYPLAGLISDVPSLLGVIFVGGAVWFGLAVLTGIVDLREVTAAVT